VLNGITRDPFKVDGGLIYANILEKNSRGRYIKFDAIIKVNDLLPVDGTLTALRSRGFLKAGATPTSSNGSINFFKSSDFTDQYFWSKGFKNADAYTRSNIAHELAGHGGHAEGDNNKFSGHIAVLGDLLTSTDPALLDAAPKLSETNLRKDAVELSAFNESLARGDIVDANGKSDPTGAGFWKDRVLAYQQKLNAFMASNGLNTLRQLQSNRDKISSIYNETFGAEPIRLADGTTRYPIVRTYPTGSGKSTSGNSDEIVVVAFNRDKNSLGEWLSSRAIDQVVIESPKFKSSDAAEKYLTRVDGAANVGSVFGSVLGRQLGGEDQFKSAVLSGAIGGLSKTLVQGVGYGIGGGFGTGVRKFFSALPSNIASAGLGAVSSLGLAELTKALGIKGFAGEVVNTAGGAVINTVIGNVFKAGPTGNPFAGTGANLVNAFGSFLGSKLAGSLVKFDTLGGQLGSAIGASLGTLGATGALGTTLGTFVSGGVSSAISALGLQAFSKVLSAILIPGIGAFVGFLIGGLIGSIFGGTPRAGADVVWDEKSKKFIAANAWSKKGGSAAAANNFASAAANNLNGVLSAIGGSLIDGAKVEGGNYGLRKKDYVWQPGSTDTKAIQDQKLIQRTFSGKDKNAGNQLLAYGVYRSLADSDFKIAGGNVYMKRALAATLAQAGSADGFEIETLVGNLSTAQDWAKYRANPLVYEALIDASKNGSNADDVNVLAAGWALTAARAIELGLNKRNASDWAGGWSYFADKTLKSSVSLIALADTPDSSGQFERYVVYQQNGSALLGYVGDTIDTAEKTRITGTSGNDVITLNGDTLTVGTGVSIDGAVWNGVARKIDVAAVIDGGAGNDTISGGDLGNDLFGGAGDDVLTGGRLDDWMGACPVPRHGGGDGNDTLNAGASGKLGGDGNYLSGGDGNDTLNGAEGSDWLEGGAGVDTLRGGGGDDILASGAGNDIVIEGGSGNDQYLFRRGRACPVQGAYAPGYGGVDVARDSITDSAPGTTLGGAAANALRSYMLGQNALALIRRNFAQQSSSADAGGDDALVLGAGITLSDVFLQRGFSGIDASGTKIANDDLIIRLLTNSVATGDEITLKDFFTSSGKIEWLVFADGTRIRIGDFTSFLVGTAGPDVLIGTDGRDFIFGGGGNDKIKALGGDDIANGGTGDDQVEGGSGNDIVIGGLDNDRLIGDSGNDLVSGDNGADAARAMTFFPAALATATGWRAARAMMCLNTAAAMARMSSLMITPAPGRPYGRTAHGTKPSSASPAMHQTT
jgi:Ca2+-binding RTX toxin-like protein